MQQDLSFIKEEHDQIREILEDLDYHIQQTYTKIDKGEFIKIFRKLLTTWETHEKHEEEAFISLPAAQFEKFTFQHRQLRGHLQVLEEAIISESDTRLWAALNTDGEMLISKLRKHMQEEENFIDNPSKTKENLQPKIKY